MFATPRDRLDAVHDAPLAMEAVLLICVRTLTYCCVVGPDSKVSA
jgi:hypothetical protein